MKKLQKHYYLDKLPVVKYIRRMFSKEIITPREFKEGRQRSDELEERRKKEIIRLSKDEKWENKDIAAYFEISESYVSRIIRGER